jgi:pseudouridine 5'-phosphatase
VQELPPVRLGTDEMPYRLPGLVHCGSFQFRLDIVAISLRRRQLKPARHALRLCGAAALPAASDRGTRAAAAGAHLPPHTRTSARTSPSHFATRTHRLTGMIVRAIMPARCQVPAADPAPMPAADLRAVVFDFDGLMFNTEEVYRHVGTEILRRRGKECTDALLTAMMGRPPKEALRTMIEWHQLAATVEQLEQETSDLFRPILRERLAPMPGLLPLLAALETAGLPKAIATSSRKSFVDEILDRFDWAARFQFVLTADDVTCGKPDPEIYLTAAQRLAIEPAQMLVLEDSQTGCRAAIAAGAYTVAVPGDHSRHHDFTGAVLVAETLGDVRIYDALRLSARRGD